MRNRAKDCLVFLSKFNTANVPEISPAMKNTYLDFSEEIFRRNKQTIARKLNIKLKAKRRNFAESLDVKLFKKILGFFIKARN